MVRDNLGSIIAVVNAAGGKVFEAEYDAWGNQTVTRNDIRLSRGYTGHEMLPQFGLIHMDGRVYDPVIGRFLSPDNYVQLPENSQSFNRYSYCINNPLKYTDPTGENFLAALAINVGVSMFCAAAEGENVWRAAAFGALGACASYGIGCAFGHTAGNVGRELLRAGAHGISGGVQSALQGGSFFSGFASGATASMAGSGAQWAGWNNAGVLNATTAGGAVGSLAFGGDWYNGASLGFSIGALNHTEDEDELIFLESLKEKLYKSLDFMGITYTGYADRIYYKNPWTGKELWTTKANKSYSSDILKPQANGKYVRGVQGIRISREIAIRSSKIPSRIGKALGVFSVFTNFYDFIDKPSVKGGVNIVRSIAGYFNWPYALADFYTDTMWTSYREHLHSIHVLNEEYGLPLNYGTINLSTGETNVYPIFPWMLE